MLLQLDSSGASCTCGHAGEMWLKLTTSPHIVTTRQECAGRHLTGEGMTQRDDDDDDDDDDDNDDDGGDDGDGDDDGGDDGDDNLIA